MYTGHSNREKTYGLEVSADLNMDFSQFQKRDSSIQTPQIPTSSHIFISYSHIDKDNGKILPIIDGLKKRGYPIWYDAGIEAGTEFPSYIADALLKSYCVISLLSRNAQNSDFCKKEITFALKYKKPLLVAYLEDFELDKGLELQICNSQDIRFSKHKSRESFIDAIAASPLVTGGAGNPIAATASKKDGLFSKNIFSYSISGDSVIITGLDSIFAKNLSIPAIIEGRPVIAIGDDAFAHNKQIKSVSLPDSVIFIGNRAFLDCKNLTSVYFPSSLIAIGNFAFRECVKLTTIQLSDGIQQIGSSAFFGCTKLESAILPDSITHIGASAFCKCHSLTHISFPKKLHYIEPYSFGDCCKLEDITIPPYVTQIRDFAFYGCSNLNRLIIPDGVTDIGTAAFARCESLNRIYIPASVKEMDYAFSRDSNWLKDISVSSYNEVYTSRDNNGQECNALIKKAYNDWILQLGCSNTKIPYGITKIGSSAFEDCFDLTELIIPSSVTTIESYAFSFCKNLNKIVLQEGLTAIEYSAFFNCKNLTCIVIPNSVTHIGDRAFANCENLSKIYIPKTTTLGKDVFENSEYDAKKKPECEIIYT